MVKPVHHLIAAALIWARQAAETDGHEFEAEYGVLPNGANNTHRRLNLVQVYLGRCPGVALSPEWLNSNRIEVLDLASGERLLLRSAATAGMKDSNADQLEMFDSEHLVEADAELIVYRYATEVLELYRVAAVRRDGAGRVLADGEPQLIGAWPYEDAAGPDPFDQGEEGAFDDLGDAERDDESGVG